MGQRRVEEPGRLSPRERLEAKMQRCLVVHTTWFTCHEIQGSDGKEASSSPLMKSHEPLNSRRICGHSEELDFCIG